MKGETTKEIVDNNIGWLMRRIAPLSTNSNLTKRYVEFAFENFIDDMVIKTKEETAENKKSTEIKDKNGDEIFFGDTLVFVDKWEWYKRSYGPKFYFADNERKEQLRKEYEAEPLEERLVENVQDYEWLLSSELQIYWEIKK